ncbi:MAG: SMI1/KNR4 family protein [Chitinophagaceae bacterium]|nr:SMI1/KNR4 family protein [Chitinophagaceae bacterium]
MTYLQKIQRLYNIPEASNDGFTDIEIETLEAGLNYRLPAKLREYYLTLGKNENINYSHNRLLKPDGELNFSDDLYLVFYEENQVVAYWGIKSEDMLNDNPPVYGNYNPIADEQEWKMDSKTTEDFLIVMAIGNGTLGGLTYNANSLQPVNPATIKYIEQNWEELKGITLTGQRIFTSNFDDVISLCIDNDQQASGIFIGTTHETFFENMLSKLDVDWDYISTEDE